MRYLSFISLFLLGCSTTLQGQMNRIAQCKVEDIIFRVEMLDYDYTTIRDSSTYNKIGDTLEIKYSVINNSDKSIYIFDPKQFYWDSSREPYWDSCFCSYIYRQLGGSWSYRPGHNPMLMLVKLDPDDEYQYTFRYILLSKNRNHCRFDISESMNWEDLRTNLILFDIGYVFESDSIKFTDEDKDGYIYFKDDKSESRFYIYLRRFLLGPLTFRIKT